LNKIKIAIEKASDFKTKDRKDALVKIALENCLREFIIPSLPMSFPHSFDLVL
jgi:hypothetical protein